MYTHQKNNNKIKNAIPTPHPKEKAPLQHPRRRLPQKQSRNRSRQLLSQRETSTLEGAWILDPFHFYVSAT